MAATQSRIDPLGELVVEIFRLNGTLLYEGDRMGRDLGMSSARWQVLGALALAGQPLSVSQIARNMGLARQSVQRTVNELTSGRFVFLTDNPDHRRAKLVAVAPKGRSAYQVIMRRQEEWSRQTLSAAALSKRHIVEAASLLRKLRETLKGA